MTRFSEERSRSSDESCTPGIETKIDVLINNYFFIFTFSCGIEIFLCIHNYSLVSYLVDRMSLFKTTSVEKSSTLKL